MARELVGVSKLLSYVLRHHPSAFGLALDGAGWIGIDTLLAALAAHGRAIDRETLDRVVATNDKRRFEVRDGRIRAAQGHSIPVDLGLEALVPPPLLYHGTIESSMPAILRKGLLPMGRHHVHLSLDERTARAVGGRRGAPVVLRVDAAGMHAAGHIFYRSANGVWLTAAVPPAWLTRSECG